MRSFQGVFLAKPERLKGAKLGNKSFLNVFIVVLEWGRWMQAVPNLGVSSTTANSVVDNPASDSSLSPTYHTGTNNFCGSDVFSSFEKHASDTKKPWYKSIFVPPQSRTIVPELPRNKKKPWYQSILGISILGIAGALASAFALHKLKPEFFRNLFKPAKVTKLNSLIEKLAPTLSLEEKKAIKANINSKVGSQEDTLLHLAIRKGDKSAIEELIQLGSKVDIQNKRGWTALHEGIDAHKPG